MRSSLLNILRCPFCAGKFQLDVVKEHRDEIESGWLQCYCDSYPVLTGIPVIRKDLSAEVVSLIQTCHYEKAILRMLKSVTPSPNLRIGRFLSGSYLTKPLGNLIVQKIDDKSRQSLRKVLYESKDPLTARNMFNLIYGNGGNISSHCSETGNYFFYRFSQPRHLCGLSFITLVDSPAKPVLDLACGAGHLTRSLQMRATPQLTVGIDSRFSSLYIAKKIIAPDGEFICCHADTPLPFVDDSFSFIFCSDSFFYFTNKLGCVTELRRLAGQDGVILLTGLHNRLTTFLGPDVGLPPEGYRSLLADIPHRIVSDSNVLARYLEKQGPALAESEPTNHLKEKLLLSVVATHRKEILRDHERFDQWPHAEGPLGINPLYVAKLVQGDKVHLRRTFPSANFEEQNAECKAYLPESVLIDTETVRALQRGERSSGVMSLIGQYVAIGLPDRYS